MTVGIFKFGKWSLLAVLLIILKLTGLINWSWWIITAPLWIVFVLALLFGFAILIIDKLKL